MIEIKWAFSTWMKRGRGINRIPPSSAWFMRNMRIKNWAVVQKQGTDYIWSAPSSYTIQALLRYKLDSTLLAVANWTLYIDAHTGSWTSVWSVWWFTTPYSMFQYGDFVLILSGRDHMYIYHDLYGLYKHWAWWATFENLPAVLPPAMDDGISSIVQAYPLMGCAITGFTIIAGNNSVTKKAIFISKPVKPDAPRLCYDFDTSAWQDYDIWENRYMDSEVLALAPSMGNVFIFCEESIEIMGRETAQVSWSIVSLSTRKIWQADQIASKNLHATVWDKVFFFTKSKQIKTINYAPWIENPEIGTISDDIQDRLDLNIDSDQDNAFAYYDRQEEHIEFHLIRDWGSSSTMPDVVICFDLNTQSRYMDDDIWFSQIIRGWSSGTRTYASNAQYLYIDNAGDTWNNRRQDNTSTSIAINAEYNTPNISLWTVNEKLFQGFIITWGIDQSASLEVKCYIDGTLIFTKTIIDNDIPTSEKSVVDTWDPTVYVTSQKIFPFQYVVDQWMLRQKGKRIRIQVKCTSTSANKFFFDGLFIDAVATGNYELSDKF